MRKHKRKPSSPYNIKFSQEQAKFIKQKADQIANGNVSAIIKDYVNRDMQVISKPTA